MLEFHMQHLYVLQFWCSYTFAVIFLFEPVFEGDTQVSFLGVNRAKVFSLYAYQLIISVSESL
jgi:hypothetical protein